MKNIKLGIIGCGNMTQAILQSIANGKMNDYLKSNDTLLEIFVSDTDSEKLTNILKLGINSLKIMQDNSQLAAASDFILFAVKPQSFEAAIKNCSVENKILISIMAGISTAKIKSLTNAKKIARVMPNLNAKVGESFSSYCCYNLNESENAFIYALLTSFGKVAQITEDKFNASTGVAGSGPAFVFMFAKAFIDTAIKNGFSYEQASLMATQTITGSIKQLKKINSVNEIERLIDSVCSKGGTTIEGVNYLSENNFEKIVANAIERAIKKSAELEKQL